MKMGAEHWIKIVSDLRIQHEQFLLTNDDNTFSAIERRIVDMGSDLIGDICFDLPPKFDRINNVMAIAKPEDLPDFLQILLVKYGGKHRDKIPAFEPFLSQIKMYMDEKGESPSSKLFRMVDLYLNHEVNLEKSLNRKDSPEM